MGRRAPPLGICAEEKKVATKDKMKMTEKRGDQVCAIAPGKLKSMITDDSMMLMMMIELMMSAEEGKEFGENTERSSSVLSSPSSPRERSESVSSPAQLLTNGRASDASSL